MKELRVPLLIRIPQDLKQQLVELAKREHRSLNQQIEYILSKSIKPPTKTKGKEEA